MDEPSEVLFASIPLELTETRAVSPAEIGVGEKTSVGIGVVVLVGVRVYVGVKVDVFVFVGVGVFVGVKVGVKVGGKGGPCLWTKTSGTIFVSPATRFVAYEVNAIKLPSAESDGYCELPFACPPFESIEIRVVIPACISWMK